MLFYTYCQAFVKVVRACRLPARHCLSSNCVYHFPSPGVLCSFAFLSTACGAEILCLPHFPAGAPRLSSQGKCRRMLLWQGLRHFGLARTGRAACTNERPGSFAGRPRAARSALSHAGR